MKTSVFYGKKDIRPEEKPIPSIKENEVLVKVMAAGICGTDVHIFHGAPGATNASAPVVLGHEFSGQVVECGSQVKYLKKGDYVTIDPNMYCGSCDYCQNGEKHFCPSMSAIGVNQDGGFEEYCAVPETQAIRLTDSVDVEEAAMAEPVSCCIHGLDKIGGIRSGETVCIIGGGAIGQIMAQLARIGGASKVIVSEPVALRRELAESLGADGSINPMEGNLNQQMKDLIGTETTNVVIECVGRPAAVQSAIELADRGGRVLLFGLPYPTDTYELPLIEVFRKELHIQGSFVNPDTQYRAAKLICQKRLNLKPLITHRFPVSKLEEAIKMQMSDASVKVMIIP